MGKEKKQIKKENKVLKSFKIYHDLMYKLSNLYFDYYKAFNQLEQQIFKESVLNEKVSDEEKEEIENKISDLENNISKVLSSISSHLKIMETLLKKENVALQETEANRINRMHISTMGDYNTCIQRLKSLEKEYKEWDFSKVNFSQTDAEKMKLNIAIKKYNDNNLKLMDYKLYDVFEAQKIAKEKADKAIELKSKLEEKKNKTTKQNVVKDLIKLELKIKASLASLKTIPRNESLNRAFKSNFKILNEQSSANWENYLQNIPAYENALQKIITTEDDFDAEYLHTNLNKLLTNASDIRELYDDTIGYIKRKRNKPEFENAYIMTRDLVNNLLAAVRELVELDETFMRTMERNNVDYVEKYKLHDVD